MPNNWDSSNFTDCAGLAVNDKVTFYYGGWAWRYECLRSANGMFLIDRSTIGNSNRVMLDKLFKARRTSTFKVLNKLGLVKTEEEVIGDWPELTPAGQALFVQAVFNHIKRGRATDAIDMATRLRDALKRRFRRLTYNNQISEMLKHYEE